MAFFILIFGLLWIVRWVQRFHASIRIYVHFVRLKASYVHIFTLDFLHIRVSGRVSMLLNSHIHIATHVVVMATPFWTFALIYTVRTANMNGKCKQNRGCVWGYGYKQTLECVCVCVARGFESSSADLRKILNFKSNWALNSVNSYVYVCVVVCKTSKLAIEYFIFASSRAVSNPLTFKVGL